MGNLVGESLWEMFAMSLKINQVFDYKLKEVLSSKQKNIDINDKAEDFEAIAKNSRQI